MKKKYLMEYWKNMLVGASLMLMSGFMSGPAFADNIYVIKQGNYSDINSAIKHLTDVGHAVTSSTATLTNYSAYDQVWDLRYSSQITSVDASAFTSFLQGGGNMYLTGEWSTYFDNRNNSLESFISGIGGGSLNFTNAVSGVQSITSAGQIVNSPHTFTGVNFAAASLGTSAFITNGFLVTEYGKSGSGSLLGWDFNDLASAPNARMLVGLDINIFRNGQNWTDNMATFLSAEVATVPEPSTLLLLGSGLVGLAGMRRRFKA